MIKEAIGTVVRGENLSEAVAAEVMSEIMAGEATDAQIAAFVIGLRMKGETVDEITGCARSMRKFATPIRVRSSVDIDREDINIDRETILDTCGTGGDGTHSFNISTATALVVAACGLTVAKHGNRSVSSACGSADVLEALGVNLNVSPEKVEACISRIGIGFLFAATLHGAMKYAIGPRKQIGVRTIFNILGPLTNPAGATTQVLGVYNDGLLEPIARVLKNLGSRRAWIVHSDDGLDEISLSAPTKIAELNKGEIRFFTLTPEEAGLKTVPFEMIRGGDAQVNAQIVLDILKGGQGPRRDIVLMNSAASLLVGGRAADLREGIGMAAAAIDSGKAKTILDTLVKMTNE
jgi:anthranilate phosphoribosyltransferase